MEPTQSKGVQGRPAVYTGHMMRAGEYTPEQMAHAGRAIAADVADTLAKRSIGALHGSLACGADIIVAEAAIARGIDLHIVLPMPIEAFRAASVSIGDMPGSDHWSGRYDACLEAATTVEVLNRKTPGDSAMAAAFDQTFRHSAGRCIEKAGETGTEPLLIAVHARGDVGEPGGTSSAVEQWTALGRPARMIDFPLPRKTGGGGAPAADPRMAMILLHPSDPALVEPLTELLSAFAGQTRRVAELADAIGVALADFPGSEATLDNIAAAIRQGDPAARTVLHFGIVEPVDGAGGRRVSADMAPDVGARLPDRPAMAASDAFAMEWLFRGGDRTIFAQAGAPDVYMLRM